MLFSFDTSVILNGRRDLMPPTMLPTLWSNIEVLIETGFVRSVDLVRDELAAKGGDEAYRWARAQRKLWVPLTLDIQRATREVLRLHPKLVGVGGRRNGADPFVIALALHEGGAVVTEETPSNTLVKPRIPEVCDDLGIPWFNLVRFVEWHEWTFS